MAANMAIGSMYTIAKFSNSSIQNLFNVDKRTWIESRKLKKLKRNHLKSIFHEKLYRIHGKNIFL